MKRSRIARSGALSLALLAALAAGPGAFAYFRYPTSSDFLSPPDKTCSAPAPAPDGRSVAYVVEDSGLKQIWVRELARPPVDRKLSDGQSNDDSPDWSPDGTKLYFSSDRGGASKIWVMDVGRGTRRQLTSGSGQDFHPRLSPSGRWLAYDSNREGNYDIWVRELNTGRNRRLTTDPAGDFSPCWSPREDEIAFTSSRGGQFHIWIQDSAGRAQARQFTSGRGANAHPDWSPDGRTLAYDSDREGTTKVYVQPVFGSTEPQAVTDLLSVEEHPRFARSGKRIFFAVKENQLAGFKAKATPAVASPPHPRLAASRIAPVPGELEAAPRSTLPPALRRNRFRGNRAVAAGKAGGLTVLQFFPASTADGAKPDAPIGAVFSKPLDEAQDFKSLVRMWESTAEMSLDASYNPSLRRLEILPDFPLRPSTLYRISLARELRAEGGATLGEAFNWSFQTAARQLARAPERIMQVGMIGKLFCVASRTPKERTGGVSPTGRIRVGFSLQVAPKSLDANSIKLYTAAGQLVPGELYFPPGDYELDLTPYEPLASGTVYEVHVSDKVRDTDGDALTGPYSWRFRTAYSGPLRVADVQPNRVLGEHPIIRLRFNRPVSRKSVESGKVVLQGQDFPYPGAVTLSGGNQILTFEPYQKLPDKQRLVLYLPVGLTDADGNGLELAGPIAFTTDVKSTPPNPMVLDKRRRSLSLAKSMAPLTRPQDGMLAHYLGTSDRELEPAPGWVVRGLATLSSYLPRDFKADAASRDGQLSRYKCALYLEQALAAYSYMKPADRKMTARLGAALRPELASLGVQVETIVAHVGAAERGARPQPAPSDFERSG